MEIFLKPDWDYQTSYEDKGARGHFIGREKEKNELIDEFLRKQNGTILVSGARGVGKTSLVFKSLQEAIQLDDHIVPIVVNASQLELHLNNKSNELPEIIIKNLIRRLYGYFQTDKNKREKQRLPADIYEKLGNLYKKAIAKEFNLSQTFSTEENENRQNQSGLIDEISYNVDKRYAIKLFYLLAIIILFLPPIWYQYVNTILAIIFFLIPNFNIKNTSRIIREQFSKFSKKNSAETLYKEDNSLSNLEYELNDILKSLSDNEIKIIFVIDELDKLESGDETHKIFDIIKTFKNLFTLSPALFVFITSDLAYKKIEDAKNNRGMHYTLFTNRIFINRPDFADMERYIEDIIFKIRIDDQDVKENFCANLTGSALKHFKNFKNYLCFESKSDFFELTHIVRDHIKSYEILEGKRFPVIILEPLSFDEILKAKLQKILGQVFLLNKLGRQSEWHKNDSILSHLYIFIDKNYYKRFSFQINSQNEFDTIINEFLIPYMERLEIIKHVDNENLTGENNTPIKNVIYEWTGNNPGEYGAKDVPKAAKFLFQEEENFINIGNKYIQQINDIDDLEVNIDKVLDGTFQKKEYNIKDGVSDGRDGKDITGINAFSIYEKYEDYLDGLQRENPIHINKEDLLTYAKDLNSEINKLKSVSLTSLGNLLKLSLEESDIAYKEQQLPNDAQIFDIVNDLRQEIINQNVVHFVIYKDQPEKSKQLLLTLNLPPELISESTMKLLHNNKSYRIINLQSNPQLDYKDKNIVYDQKIVNRSKKKKPITQLTKEISSSFHNINLTDDYIIFAEVIKNTADWFRE